MLTLRFPMTKKFFPIQPNIALMTLPGSKFGLCLYKEDVISPKLATDAGDLNKYLI